MRCSQCGTENPANVVSCVRCGSPLPADNQYQQPQYAQPNQYQQPQYQQPQYQQPQYQQPYMVEDPYRGHSMKWYKFLIYFALIASALVNIGTGIMYLTQGNYTIPYGSKNITGKEARDLIYMYAPGLKGADTFYAIALFISAVLLFAAWFTLFKKMKNGPLCLYLSFGFNAIISVVYIIWVNSANNGVLENVNTMITSTIVSACFAVFMIAVNIVYFNKRKDIFVN